MRVIAKCGFVFCTRLYRCSKIHQTPLTTTNGYRKRGTSQISSWITLFSLQGTRTHVPGPRRICLSLYVIPQMGQVRGLDPTRSDLNTLTNKSQRGRAFISKTNLICSKPTLPLRSCANIFVCSDVLWADRMRALANELIGLSATVPCDALHSQCIGLISRINTFIFTK